MSPRRLRPAPDTRSLRPAVWGAALCSLVAALASLPAQAQFAMVPTPVPATALAPSEAPDAAAYRLEAARHLYATFPTRVHKGKLPPMMYAVMITEADLDAAGQVQSVRVVRPPAAAPEVTPWVLSLIRRAAPYPAPARLEGAVATWREIWLVDRTGLFQVDALTEGQR